MTELIVPRHNNFNDFLEETDTLFPTYENAASSVIRNMTIDNLRRNTTPHPDGFLKMQIGPANGAINGQVRLHFWVPGMPASDQPHSHPWHIVSNAFHQEYAEYQPELIEDPTAKLKKFRVTYPNSIDVRAGVSQVSPDTTFRAETGTRLLTRERSTHSLAAHEIHMSSPSKVGGITLAVMSPRFTNKTYFYAPTDEPPMAIASEEDLERVMEMINEIKKHI